MSGKFSKYILVREPLFTANFLILCELLNLILVYYEKSGPIKPVVILTYC